MNKSSFKFVVIYLKKMLQHIALTINDSEEIESFYEEVLLFNLLKKFSINEDITGQLFGVEKLTDVIYDESSEHKI